MDPLLTLPTEVPEVGGVSVAKLAELCRLAPAQVIAAYLFGSRVYGTEKPTSDYDYVVVVANGAITEPETQVCAAEHNVEITIVTEDHHQTHLDEHDMKSLECYFSPAKYKLHERRHFTFILDKPKLRNQISWRCDHSWTKATKKLTVAKDLNVAVGKKSLFHAFRIIMYGIQVAKSGTITNWQEANAIWTEIDKNPSESWDDYKAAFRPRYNKLKSELRLVAPLE